ncbi:hypothetical protein IWX92DRAFT_370470 [Phyllosticta citricarpa]
MVTVYPCELVTVDVSLKTMVCESSHIKTIAAGVLAAGTHALAAGAPTIIMPKFHHLPNTFLSTLTPSSISISLVLDSISPSPAFAAENASLSPPCHTKDSSPPFLRPKTASGAFCAASKPSPATQVPTPQGTPTFLSGLSQSPSRAWSATGGSTKTQTSPSPKTSTRFSRKSTRTSVTIPCPSSRSRTTWTRNSSGSWRSRRRRRTRPCWRSWQ